MIKFKLFFKSTEKEEEWIDKVQKSGYAFTGINSFLPAFYYFKRDKEKDKMSINMSYYKYTCEHVFFSLFYFFLLIRTTSITIFDPKSWYLTQGLWEMQGKIFWLAFLFETPFALLRILPMFYFLISGIYYITRAVKPKEIIN
ncbi:TPA: DUF2812 domain-containing protein [Streptococcus agalactiae]|nr:DUF2812 domain-containing protein [Streptococcus agalactiae]